MRTWIERDTFWMTPEGDPWWLVREQGEGDDRVHTIWAGLSYEEAQCFYVERVSDDS